MAVHKYSLLELHPFFVKPSSFAVVIGMFLQDFFIVRVNVIKFCVQRLNSTFAAQKNVKQETVHGNHKQDLHLPQNIP